MQCPFLKESEVKYCGSSSLGKMIRKTPWNSGDEKCSTPAYKECGIYKPLPEEEQPSRCPYMREKLVQYCAAAAVTKFIPYSESLLSRCGNDNHRYCDLYIAMANPEPRTTATAVPAYKNNGGLMLMTMTQNDCLVDGVRVPPELFYSNNHMWLDVTPEGSCHVGIDGFLAKILGRVDQVTFVTFKGVDRPTAVLRVRGIDVHVVFPNPMLLTGSNLYLRANPEKLTSDPYASGWLFEGVTPPPHGTTSVPVCAGLMQGEQAAEWMEHEVGRITEFVHSKLARTEGLVMDGGVFSGDLVRHLTHEELIDLLNEFFLPHATWIKE